jgi:putative transposase
MARKSKFSEAQMIGAIKEVEAGASPTEVARRLGTSYESLNRWRQKYSGMTVPEAKEKKRLEDENTKLKRLVAQFALEIDTLKAALGKNW